MVIRIFFSDHNIYYGNSIDQVTSADLLNVTVIMIITRLWYKISEWDTIMTVYHQKSY